MAFKWDKKHILSLESGLFTAKGGERERALLGGAYLRGACVCMNNSKSVWCVAKRKLDLTFREKKHFSANFGRERVGDAFQKT